MKTIRLGELTIKDFQGGNFTLNVGNSDATVYADNGIGKTRLFSAFTFLLFGKDSLNRSTFAIKNLNADGDVAEHGIQHTVEGVLDVDGELVTLKKVYSEKFETTRGRPEAEFKGHTTRHFINSVPKSEKEYKEYIQEIAGDEQTFRLLTSPTAFPMLPWQKQRELLLSIFGDVSDADIIADDPQLSDLPAILGKHKVDDYKRIVSARQSELVKSLGSARQPGTIETRIDEQRRSLTDVIGLDRAVLASEIQRLESLVSESKLKLAGVDNGGGIAELSKRLAGVNADLRAMETAHYSATMQTANRLTQQITEISDFLRSRKSRQSAINNDITRKTTALDRIGPELGSLRIRWAEIDGEAFQDGTPDTCAACNQPLPSHLVHDAREKALAAFNNDKANRLTDIEKRGNQLSDDQKSFQSEIDALTTELKVIADGISEAEGKVQTLSAERDAVKARAEDYSALPKRDSLIVEINDINEKIAAERTGHAHDADAIKMALQSSQSSLAVVKEQADRFVRREAGEARIKSLKNEEKLLSVEAEKLAHHLYLIDLFTRKKVDMLNNKMTGQFEFVRWKLAEIQVNGAINDQMCELMVNGVGYNSGLNSAGRIQAGCDIIRTLQRHYGIAPVLWIDNRESVVKLPDMPCQVISLVVSPHDDKLRVELVEARQAVAA